MIFLNIRVSRSFPFLLIPIDISQYVTLQFVGHGTLVVQPRPTGSPSIFLRALEDGWNVTHFCVKVIDGCCCLSQKSLTSTSNSWFSGRREYVRSDQHANGSSFFDAKASQINGLVLLLVSWQQQKYIPYRKYFVFQSPTQKVLWKAHSYFSLWITDIFTSYSCRCTYVTWSCIFFLFPFLGLRYAIV